MSKLRVTDFSGGIINAIEPHLLDPKFSVSLTNADVSTGSLVPHKGLKEVSDPKIPELTNLSKSRSIIRFGNNYYWSDNDSGELDSTLGYFGIKPPSSSPLIKFGSLGNNFSGVYRYKFRFVSDFGDYSSTSLPGSTSNSIEVDASNAEIKKLTDNDFLDFDRRWNYHLQAHSPWEFKVGTSVVNYMYERYYGYKKGSIVNYNGKTWQANVNIVISINDNTESGFLLPTNWNDFNYLTQFFKDNTGSFISHTITMGGIPDKYLPGSHGDVWTDVSEYDFISDGYESFIISRFPRPNDPNIKFIEIFRTTSNGSDFYLVDKVSVNSKPYKDTVDDAGILLNLKLTDLQSYSPIYRLSSGGFFEESGGKYLTEVNEKYLLANGTRVYESDQRNINAFGIFNYLEFDGDVTGIASFDDERIIFTGHGNPYIVSGDSADNTISKQKTNNNLGLDSWRTIAEAENTVLWKARQGIAAIQKLPLGQGRQLVNLTKNKYKFTGSEVIQYAVAHDNVYYLFMDGEVLAFDLERDLLYKLGITADYGISDKNTGKFYLHNIGLDKYYEFGAGDNLEINYLSPKFSMGDLGVLQNFTDLEIMADKDVTYSVWFDNKKVVSDRVMELTSKKKKKDEHGLPEGWAYTIQIQLKSYGKIKGWAVEFYNSGDED
jgi:hypothetical protein